MRYSMHASPRKGCEQHVRGRREARCDARRGKDGAGVQPNGCSAKWVFSHSNISAEFRTTLASRSGEGSSSDSSRECEDVTSAPFYLRILHVHLLVPAVCVSPIRGPKFFLAGVSVNQRATFASAPDATRSRRQRYVSRHVSRTRCLTLTRF